MFIANGLPMQLSLRSINDIPVNTTNTRYSISDSIASVSNTNNTGTVTLSSNNTVTNRFKTNLMNVVNFIRNWGPNHIIIQAGPQMHNTLTGIDYKFTPTAVIASDHAEIYPFHNEVGRTFLSENSSFVKGYALSVHQQGVNIDWKNWKLGYLRQILGRVEADFPYGDSGLQGTIGIEVGVTDKTTGLKNAFQHAVSDFQTSSAQTLALTGLDFAANPKVIEIITGALIGAFTLPEVISRMTNPDNSRESVLWVGISLGYADYNGTLLPDMEIIQDNQHQGLNIQTNAYIRHGEMITYNFQNKKFTIPHALIKTLTLLNGGSKPDFIRNILSAQADINHHINQGHIPAVAGQTANDCLDEIAAAGCSAIDNNIDHRLEPDNITTHM
ncbi:hypothetical protein [Enterobacter bugandensis]|uniref:hypothetical protein n=1 Tax=Enterobacter bugandensis TaxID=881260 RepID=UPI0023629B0E|nr:hypothetical protein [Enterobacter bugandensis]